MAIQYIAREKNEFHKHVSTRFLHIMATTPICIKVKNCVEVRLTSGTKYVLYLKGTKLRQTMMICDTCKVSLCGARLQGEEKNEATHSSLWHSCVNVVGERESCHNVRLQSKRIVGAL